MSALTKEKSRSITKRLIDYAKSNNGRVHIIFRGEDKWAVKKEGDINARRILNTRQEAIQFGKLMVKNGKASMIIIHKKDGNIE